MSTISGARSRARVDSTRSRARRERALREECRRWAAELGVRRTAPAVLHVAAGLVEVRVEVDPCWDLPQCCDLLTRLLDDADGPADVWLTRAGGVESTEADRLWGAAARTAAARLGRHPRLWVVTRRSWREQVGGEERVFTRLRSSGGVRPRGLA